jgi:YesN/AraC family two-component response regulator
VQTAAKMLDTTSIQIQEVASYVGINDPNCFSKIFKKHTGSAPSKYRKGGRR